MNHWIAKMIRARKTGLRALKLRISPVRTPENPPPPIRRVFILRGKTPNRIFVFLRSPRSTRIYKDIRIFLYKRCHMPATFRRAPALPVLLLFIAMVALAGTASAEIVIISGQTDTTTTAAAWNEIGNTFSSQYRWDAAIDAYTKAIALDPANARAYFNRGKAHAALKQYDEAIADYEKAVAIDPTLGALVEHYLDTALSLRYPPIPSGSLVKGSWQPGNQYLAIDNSGGTSDLLVALAPRGSKGAQLAVYVAKGYQHTFEQAVPPGAYDVYITFGERWDTSTKSFAKVGGYLKWELPQYFTGSARNGYTMTFIKYKPQSYPWSYTLTPIPEDQFPVF